MLVRSNKLKLKPPCTTYRSGIVFNSVLGVDTIGSFGLFMWKTEKPPKAFVFLFGVASKYNAPAPTSNVVADVAAKDSVIGFAALYPVIGFHCSPHLNFDS